jgi:hypothetical protein
LLADALAVELALEVDRIPGGGSTDGAATLNFDG